MNPKSTYQKTLAETIIKNMQKRQIEACYCETSKEAVEKASSYLTKGAVVSFGGSMTLSECGLMDSLKANPDITLLDRSLCKTPEEITELYHKALNSDFYFMSSNAITTDGKLVNTDGTGNRTAALIYGPKNVIILAGMNKVVKDEAAGLARIHEKAAPPNSVRLNRNTPCANTGICADCQNPDCICCETVITRRSAIPNRIKVILIGEELGY
ncbi:MAG: lactate utilization protein [Lachnospiraceae bacterium]|uniref:lactate utilization protein n=1 Tax=Roseburia hominis TaxID=301301 RepID=UPI001F1917D3|nr:lactate utilization protein [Roseburia hominis]MCI5713315.1 lactate utilization protein [Lachnospiraceae bacterium]MDD6170119.1 lactate utilization protein [Lachnospiraceae bacterium]MDY4838584.1 lactate utilization protein [Lachnospiraceae bacterium]